ILYLADDVNDKIYKASKPSGITNSPQDLAYDGTNLYILVDGANKDHVVVVNATSGAVVRDFDAPSRESQSLTYLNSFLYVGAAEEIPGQGLMRTITKISPVDGAVQAGNITIPMELNGRITGLSNNGSSLIGTQDQGMFAVFMNPTNGSFQKRVDFYDTPYMDGFSSLAFYDPSDDLFVTRGGKVLRVDDDGRGLSEFNTALTNLKGSVFVAEILYLAEATGNTIQAAAIPLPSTTVTTTPKGMATNGANLYLVVDGDPKDKILVLSTNPGTILNSYDAPGDNTNALAWHNGSLYAVTNEFHPNRGQQPPRVFKLNPANGAVVEEFDIKAPWGGTLGGMAGGLASDGSFLYVAMQNEQGSGWYRLNPATPNANSVRTDTSSPNITGFMTSFQSLEVAEAIPGEPRLLAGGYATREGPGQIPVVTRFNKATGEMLDLWEMGNAEITGMAYIGTVLYLADATSDAILSTSLPENIPEITAVGSYQATLRVLHASVTVNSSPTVNFSLVRNTNPRVRITSPAPNFSTVNDVIGVQGRVSDPSIKQVLVGVDLPFTSLLQDSVTPQQSAGKWNVQGQWYVSCNEWQQDRPFPKNASSPCSWRYGLQGQFPFAPSITTQGTLTTRDPILIGTGANLSFGTWYDTEPVPDRDLKRVEVAEVTKDEDGNDVVGEFKAIIQIVGRGFGQSAPPANAHSTFSYREIEQARIDFDPQTGLPVPSFTGVGKSLSAFNGKRILIRFNFDSVNNFANDGFGWFLDDIVVSGAGFKGELVNVTPLNPPIVEGTTTWFSQFTKPLGLADGLNTIRAVGELPYPPKPNGPNLKGQAQVSGFLDRAAPQVSLSGITPITATTIQTLMGTVDDMNFDSMEITQTNVFGTQTIYAINALPGNRSFSVPVSLLEGENIFEATAIDQSDLTSTVSLTAYLDTAGPTLTPLNTRYPVGAFSARAGDEAILQVNASDARGVQRVYITNPNGTLEDMVRSSEIPEAVLHQWGVTGGWLLPIEIPSGAPPGAYQLTVTALDNAQNTTVRTLQADVVATLRGFTFSLMPGSNLISMPLIPDTSSIVELLNAEVLAAIDTIMYYDASLTALPQEDRWLMFSPSAPPGVNTLTQLNTGLGYFFKMKSTAFSYSAPLAPGLPPTPRPIQFSYTGVFLKEATVPPTYPVVPGWVMMGFHSELVLPVTTALRSLEVPYPVWASLYQYDNLIRFSLEEDPEIILGGFRRVLSTGYLEPGRGYWIYVVQSGTIVP
ncbi:MAG: Ig-like domain (Group 3), partial [Dehalococcoidia bacterium]|nr:Ig-like domain (Group 3) [Dehalococcoidia bacterium]